MDFKKIIENTIVPMNFSVEEKTACYDKIIRKRWVPEPPIQRKIENKGRHHL